MTISGGVRRSASRDKISRLDRMGQACGNKRLRQSAFYLLLLILATLTCVDFVKLIITYLTDNVDSDMYIQFNDTMIMPNLTFCISKEHAWSHFKTAGLNDSEYDIAVKEGLKNMTDHDSFLGQSWDYRMVVDAYLVIQAVNSLELEASWRGVLLTIGKLKTEPRLDGMRRTINKWLGIIKERNVTFEEFRQKVGVETLKRSLQRFQRLSSNEDGRQIRNSVKITWLSQMQLCFQPLFDLDNFKPIEDQDQFFTISLAHNTENVERIECASLDVKGRPSSEIRFQEGKGRSRDGFFEELCIGDNYEIEMEIRTIYTSLPGAEEVEKKCTIYEGEIKSEYECRSRCRMELLRKACSCTPLTLSHMAQPDELIKFPPCDFEKCNIDFEANNFTGWDNICGNKCFPECTQIRYIIHHSKKTAPRKEVLQVTLFWGSFEYLRLIQKEKWSFSKFFSNLGGSLGVWLGLSVLSVIQFITFLLTRAHKRVKRKLSTISSDGRNGRRPSRASSDASVSGSVQSSNNNSLGGTISMNPFGARKEKQ